jgi:hypothetical protein
VNRFHLLQVVLERSVERLERSRLDSSSI